MPKTKLFTNFLCTGCQKKFDPEIHVPFLGRCSHSLCGICINEKQIEACHVCGKEGAFESKQRNDLASELLTAMAENEAVNLDKLLFVADDSAYANQPMPAILDPKNRPFLAKIVNQLDPVSFLKLSSTCKSLHNYCFNFKEVKIVYEISCMSIGTQNGAFGFKLQSEYEKSSFSRYRPTDYVGYGCGFLGSAVNRKKLRNYPVTFKIKDLYFKTDIGSDFIAKTRLFFEEFPIQAISNVFAAQIINDWSGFIHFLQDFHVGEVRTNAANQMFGTSPTIPEEAAIYLLQNTAYFNSNYHISEKLVRNASVPNLYLEKTLISKDTFLNLIEKFAISTDDINWTMCYDGPFGHYDLFRTLSVDYKEPLPEERPLAFTVDEHPEIFWILRKDGKYLRCWSNNKIEFLTTPDLNVPYGLIEWDNAYDVDSDDSDFM